VDFFSNIFLRDKRDDGDRMDKVTVHATLSREFSEIFIPKPVWAIGFALEQPLHVVALACSASGILKQLQYKRLFCPSCP
jgi:hypothetical protein